jgi:hypothetical protein
MFKGERDGKGERKGERKREIKQEEIAYYVGQPLSWETGQTKDNGHQLASQVGDRGAANASGTQQLM